MALAPRPPFRWSLRTRTLELGPRTLVMGVLNLTPDSFSDGGQFLGLAAALPHALHMLDSGADILDLGGESTRPAAQPVTPVEEQARVLPVLRAILAARPDAVVSIDTYHAETARLAVEDGAEIVNDVSGHLWDAAMAATCAALGCANVLMHTRGRPWEWRTLPALAAEEVVPLVLGDLRTRAEAALGAGIARESIVLDPGFGFGKRLEENLPLLAGLDQLHSLGFPIVAGLSRKSFLRPAHYPAAPPVPPSTRPGAAGYASETWARQASSPPDDLLATTTAANAAAILAGAHILRVHEVAAARTAAAVADRLLAADLHTGNRAC
jgi:dihydropteroate synthase